MSVKKILVLGSQGYLGTRLTRYLDDYGYKVGGVDVGTFADCVISDNFVESKTIKKDASTICKKDLQGYDVVINLASNSNDPTSHLDSKFYYQPAITFSESIARDCRDLGIKYIFPSSCSVYGFADGYCDETTPPNPITDYSRSKLKIEEKLSVLARQDFTPVALRLSTVFGYSPRMRFDIVVNMFTGMLLTVNKILLNSNGTSWRPHLYIEDAIEALRCTIEWNSDSGRLEVFNVGNNSNNLTIRRTAEIISSFSPTSKIEYLNQSLEESIFSNKNIINQKDPRSYQVNFEKIYKLIPEFKRKTSLSDGVSEMIGKLNKHKFTTEMFKSNKFYRLQYLENVQNNQ